LSRWNDEIGYRTYNKQTTSSSADETANANFFTTTSYTHYKIRKLRYNLTGSLQKFYHSKIRLAVKFEKNTE